MSRLVVAGRISKQKMGFGNTHLRVVEVRGECPDGFVWNGTQYVSLGTPPQGTSYALEKLLRSAAHLCKQEWKR